MCLLRVMELPYAFQCCAFISCEKRGGGLSWEREEAADSTAKDPPFLSSQGKQMFPQGTSSRVPAAFSLHSSL